MIQGEITVVGRTMQIAVEQGSYRKRDEQTLIADGWELINNGCVLDDVWYNVYEKVIK